MMWRWFRRYKTGMMAFMRAAVVAMRAVIMAMVSMVTMVTVATTRAIPTVFAVLAVLSWWTRRTYTFERYTNRMRRY